MWSNYPLGRVSVVKTVLVCEIQELELHPSTSAEELQHQHKAQGARVKAGGVFLSAVALQSKSRWLNHLDVHKPQCQAVFGVLQSHRAL